MEYKVEETFECFSVNDRTISDRALTSTKSSINSEKNFRLLRKVLTLFNVYFTFGGETKFKKRSRMLQLLTFTNIYMIFLISVEIRSFFLVKTSIGVAFSLTSGIVIITTLRIFVLKQAKSISRCLEMSYQLLGSLSEDPSPSVMSHIPISIAFGVLITATFFVVYIYDFDMEATLHSYKNYYFLGWIPDNKNPILTVISFILVTFVEILEYITIYFFPGIVLILCCYQFSVIVGINKALANKVKTNLDIKVAMKEFLSCYAEVEYVVMASESAISPLIFFVYGYIMCCLFQVTGVLVTSVVGAEVAGLNFILLILSMLLLVSGIVSFIALSVHTSRIHRSALSVRRHVFKLLSTRGQQGVDYGLYSVLLLLADDYPRQTGVTGWRFFALDGQFALKGLGGIITYAVILIQVSTHNL